MYIKYSFELDKISSGKIICWDDTAFELSAYSERASSCVRTGEACICLRAAWSAPAAGRSASLAAVANVVRVLLSCNGEGKAVG